MLNFLTISMELGHTFVSNKVGWSTDLYQTKLNAFNITGFDPITFGGLQTGRKARSLQVSAIAAPSCGNLWTILDSKICINASGNWKSEKKFTIWRQPLNYSRQQALNQCHWQPESSKQISQSGSKLVTIFSSNLEINLCTERFEIFSTTSFISFFML